MGLFSFVNEARENVVDRLPNFGVGEGTAEIDAMKVITLRNKKDKAVIAEFTIRTSSTDANPVGTKRKRYIPIGEDWAEGAILKLVAAGSGVPAKQVTEAMCDEAMPEESLKKASSLKGKLVSFTATPNGDYANVEFYSLGNGTTATATGTKVSTAATGPAPRAAV